MNSHIVEAIIEFFRNNHNLKGVNDVIVDKDCEKLREMLILLKR